MRFHSHNGKVCVSLSFKDIGTNKKHRHAITPSFDVSTTIATRVIGVNTLICGSKVTVGLDFHGGKTLRLLMNWRTMEARVRDLDPWASLSWLIALKVAGGSGYLFHRRESPPRYLPRSEDGFLHPELVQNLRRREDVHCEPV